MNTNRNSSENEAQEKSQNRQTINENQIKKFKNVDDKRKIKSGNYNKYFGKSTTRHKLSKYLGGLNTNNDLKMRNKQEEYNIEALNTKTISKESELMTNDQLKKSEAKQNSKSKAQYWGELRQAIMKNDTESNMAVESNKIKAASGCQPTETQRNLKQEHIEKCIKKKIPATQVSSREDFFRDQQKHKKSQKNPIYGSCVVPNSSPYVSKAKLELLVPGGYRALHSSKDGKQNAVSVRHKLNKHQHSVCSDETSKRLKERKFLQQHLKQKAMKTKDHINQEEIRDASISDDYGKDSTLHDIVKDLKKCDRLTDSLSFESSELKSHKGEKENFNIFKTHQCTKRKFKIDSSFNNELYGEMNCNSEIIASDIEAEEVSTKEDKESSHKQSEGKSSPRQSVKECNLKWMITMTQVYSMVKSENPLDFRTLIGIWKSIH